MPVDVAAYSVVGEREQGTLEPVLTTPIRREEFLLAKALAAFVPSLVISYVVFGLSSRAALFAQPAVVSAALRTGSARTGAVHAAHRRLGHRVGMAISTRSSEVRVAQQLGALVSLPSSWWPTSSRTT